MLKPISPDATVSVVWHQDPAFDPERSRVKEYLDNRARDPSCWRDLLVVRDGQQPTEFLIGTIPPTDLSRFEEEAKVWTSEPQIQRLYLMCFLRGIREIKNGPDPNPPKVRNGDGSEYIDPSWLERNFRRDLRHAAVAIGNLIYVWNNLPEDDAKN